MHMLGWISEVIQIWSFHRERDLMMILVSFWFLSIFFVMFGIFIVFGLFNV